MTEEHDPLDIHGQERASAENAEEERRQRDEKISDLCKVMGTKEGRRFMWRLLSDAGVFRLSFNTDVMRMAFNEGNRNTGLEHFNDIMNACPHLYSLMIDEHRKSKERHEQRLADRRNKQPRR